jgi:methylated-DNA-[protein]-cysteine S-methyltransferase
MISSGFHVFPSPLGPCGIAWSARGIAGIQLPEADAQATRRRLARRFRALAEAEPDAAVGAAIERIVALLAGADPDLSAIVLDHGAVPDFDRAVYELTRRIPRGATSTYGDLARQLGDIALAREVGRALGANPTPIVVPCHRVLAAAGTGGFSARGGVSTKLRLLAIEGAPGIQNGLFD